MLKFIKQILVSTLMFFSSLSCVNSLECVSMNNQKCNVRPEVVNFNSNEPLFYPFSIKRSKCSGSCNIINDCLLILIIVYSRWYLKKDITRVNFNTNAQTTIY